MWRRRGSDDQLRSARAVRPWVVVVSRVVVVVSVDVEPLAPMVLLLPVEEPEPDEPLAPMELPLPEPVVLPVEPVVLPVEPDEPEAPIDEVDGELVDGELLDEPLEAVSLLVLGLDELEPLVPEPEAPMVLLEPLELGVDAVESELPAVAGLPGIDPLGDGLTADPALPPLAEVPEPAEPPAPDEPEPWATAMPLMARAAAAARVVSVFLVALMSTP